MADNTGATSQREVTGDSLRDEARLRFLVSVGETLVSSLDYQTTLNSIARIAVPFLADLCVIDILDAGEIRPIAVAHVDPLDEERVRDMRRRFPLDLSSAAPVGLVMRSGEPLLIPIVPDALQHDISQADEHYQILHALHYRSAIVVPIRAHGATIGTIMLISTRDDRRYDTSDLVLAEEFASRAADAVDNARLFSAEQHARRIAEQAVMRVERLLTVTEAFSRAMTPAEVAQVVVEQTVGVLGASTSAVFHLNAAERRIELITEAGIPDSDVGPWVRIPLDAPVPSTHVVQSGQPIWLSSHAERIHRYPMLARSPVATAGASAAIPLIVDDRITGVLGISFNEERVLSEAERTFVLVLARQCAQALERARLFAAEQRARADAELQSRRMTRLQEVTASFSRALTPAQVSDIVVGQAIDALGALYGAVLLLNEDGSALELAGHLNYPPEVIDGWRSIPVDMPVPATDAIRHGAAIWLGSRREAVERYSALANSRTTGANAFAAIPLTADGETIGVLTLSFADDVVFADEDRVFLTLLAQQGALTLERARLYEAERRARASAESAARVREEFLSIAAHELKTPLTSVKGFSQVLLRQLHNPTADQHRILDFATALDSQVIRLEELVADLLDVTRIEQGRLALRPATVDLSEIAARVILQFESAPERGEQHTLTLDAPKPVIGSWDAGRIEQVLVNLVSNALKYSAGGEILVQVIRADETATLTVTDHGIGISADDQRQLFTPFMRTVEARRTVSGTGLGLYISARIVEAHGGTIAVTSVPSHGSTFTVRLPLGVD